jgi:hypothetical protein
MLDLAKFLDSGFLYLLELTRIENQLRFGQAEFTITLIHTIPVPNRSADICLDPELPGPVWKQGQREGRGRLR